MSRRTKKTSPLPIWACPTEICIESSNKLFRIAITNWVKRLKVLPLDITLTNIPEEWLFKDDEKADDSKKSTRSHWRRYYTPPGHRLMHPDDVSASKEGAHDTYDF